MEITEQYIDVRMTREDLEDIPDCPLPTGYSMRWYRPGDEGLWHRIQSLADRYNRVYPGLFQKEFGTDVKTLCERQCFLCDSEGNAIGTASAWFDNRDGQSFGRVHWVAITPRHQGKGLGSPLLASVCNRLKNLGHSKTFLTTQTCRVPAINLYAKFGFVPVIDSDESSRIWHELFQYVKYLA